MEAWKWSASPSPGGLLSKDEPHLESQPKKKQTCLEGEAIWMECGSILPLSVFYCSSKKEAFHSLWKIMGAEEETPSWFCLVSQISRWIQNLLPSLPFGFTEVTNDDSSQTAAQYTDTPIRCCLTGVRCWEMHPYVILSLGGYYGLFTQT